MFKLGDLVKFKINISSRARKGDIGQIIGTSPTYLDIKFWYVKLSRPKPDLKDDPLGLDQLDGQWIGEEAFELVFTT